MRIDGTRIASCRNFLLQLAVHAEIIDSDLEGANFINVLSYTKTY
jgi:hypothetical protein